MCPSLDTKRPLFLRLPAITCRRWCECVKNRSLVRGSVKTSSGRGCEREREKDEDIQRNYTISLSLPSCCLSLSPDLLLGGRANDPLTCLHARSCFPSPVAAVVAVEPRTPGVREGDAAVKLRGREERRAALCSGGYTTSVMIANSWISKIRFCPQKMRETLRPSHREPLLPHASIQRVTFKRPSDGNSLACTASQAALR